MHHEHLGRCLVAEALARLVAKMAGKAGSEVPWLTSLRQTGGRAQSVGRLNETHGHDAESRKRTSGMFAVASLWASPRDGEWMRLPGSIGCSVISTEHLDTGA